MSAVGGPKANSAGKMAERGRIIRASFAPSGELEKAVIKATRHKVKRCKEKHVRKIILFTYDGSMLMVELLFFMHERLILPDWIIAVKTLTLCHRILRDGSPRFIQELKHRDGFFDMKGFKDKDVQSEGARKQSLFVRKYGRYLEEKVAVYKHTGFEFERSSKPMDEAGKKECFQLIQPLQSQLNALLNCKIPRVLDNPMTMNAFEFLVKDSFALYRQLNAGIIKLLEYFDTMTVEECEKALEIYVLFGKETDSVNELYDTTKAFIADLPEFNKAPVNLITTLQSHIADLKSGVVRLSKGASRPSDPPISSPPAPVVTPVVTPASASLAVNLFDFEETFDSNDDFAPRWDMPSAAPATDPFARPPPAQQPPTSTAFNFDPYGSSSAPTSAGISPMTSPSTPPRSVPSTPPSQRQFDPFADEDVNTHQTTYDLKKLRVTSVLGGHSSQPLAPQPQQSQQTRQQPTKLPAGPNYNLDDDPMLASLRGQPQSFYPFAPSYTQTPQPFYAQQPYAQQQYAQQPFAQQSFGQQPFAQQPPSNYQTQQSVPQRHTQSNGASADRELFDPFA